MKTDLFTRKAVFEPNRKAGLDRLQAFVPFAGSAYANGRNHDFGPDDRSNVSALSPWVRHRLITEHEICARVLDRFALSSAEKFIQEVLWRTYWKGWLELRPEVFDRYEATRDAGLAEMDANMSLIARYDAAVSGQTGIDCFDAWSRQLIVTGYLHNHARMWFASIWVFTLELPWALGADFFYRHLMDGDAASNTLSWRWVAGLQTRGKAYTARRSNIVKYTGGRFDPSGIVETIEPLSDAPFGPPGALPVTQTADPAKTSFVILTDDDSSFETQLPAGLKIIGAASVSTLDARSSLPAGHCAKAFNDGALADAASRFAAQFGIAAPRLDKSALIDNIKSSGAQQVVLPWPTAGTSRNTLGPLIDQMERDGFTVIKLRREWDSRAWPRATKGFFAFKEHIPDLLVAAGLDTKSKHSKIR